MKTKIKYYWVLVALFIFANIGIFEFFSHKLETFVINYTIDDAQAQAGIQ